MTRKIQDASAVKLPRVTKGKRPYFFADQSIDQVMTFFLELMTEVLVLRDRQDTLERLLDEKGAVNRADIRSYIPSSDVEAERGESPSISAERSIDTTESKCPSNEAV